MKTYPGSRTKNKSRKGRKEEANEAGFNMVCVWSGRPDLGNRDHLGGNPGTPE